MVGHGAVVVVMVEVCAGIGGAVVTAGVGGVSGVRAAAGIGAGEFVVVGLGAGEEGGEETHCWRADLRLWSELYMAGWGWGWWIPSLQRCGAL